MILSLFELFGLVHLYLVTKKEMMARDTDLLQNSYKMMRANIIIFDYLLESVNVILQMVLFLNIEKRTWFGFFLTVIATALDFWYSKQELECVTDLQVYVGTQNDQAD